MRPLLHELLHSIRWTFDEKVVPHVGDALAASYARSLSALLEQAELRARHEATLLAEESADLRTLLATQGVKAAAAAAAGPAGAPEALEAEVENLRRQLITLMKAGPVPNQRGLDAYLQRQLDRDALLDPVRKSPGM